MLDELKYEIVGIISEKIDTLKLQNKQTDESDALAIFCPKCRKKHALRECPLDAKVVETCVICSEKYETKCFPSLPGLKVVFQEETPTNSTESLNFVSRRPWQGPQTQGFHDQMYNQPPPNWNYWQQPWPQFQNQSQTWAQGAQNPYGRYSQYYQYPPYPHFPPQKNIQQILNRILKIHNIKIHHFHYHFLRKQISYLPNPYQTPTTKILRTHT